MYKITHFLRKGFIKTLIHHFRARTNVGKRMKDLEFFKAQYELEQELQKLNANKETSGFEVNMQACKDAGFCFSTDRSNLVNGLDVVPRTHK